MGHRWWSGVRSGPPCPVAAPSHAGRSWSAPVRCRAARCPPCGRSPPGRRECCAGTPGGRADCAGRRPVERGPHASPVPTDSPPLAGLPCTGMAWRAAAPVATHQQPCGLGRRRAPRGLSPPRHTVAPPCAGVGARGEGAVRVRAHPVLAPVGHQLPRARGVVVAGGHGRGGEGRASTVNRPPSGLLCRVARHHRRRHTACHDRLVHSTPARLGSPAVHSCHRWRRLASRGGGATARGGRPPLGFGGARPPPPLPPPDRRGLDEWLSERTPRPVRCPRSHQALAWPPTDADPAPTANRSSAAAAVQQLLPTCPCRTPCAGASSVARILRRKPSGKFFLTIFLVQVPIEKGRKNWQCGG